MAYDSLAATIAKRFALPLREVFCLAATVCRSSKHLAATQGKQNFAALVAEGQLLGKAGPAQTTDFAMCTGRLQGGSTIGDCLSACLARKTPVLAVAAKAFETGLTAPTYWCQSTYRLNKQLIPVVLQVSKGFVLAGGLALAQVLQQLQLLQSW